MIGYYGRLAAVGMRRQPGLTLLIVGAIGLGVALTMTAYTVLYVMSRDPIPGKSSQLFAVQLDNGGPSSRKPGDDEPPQQVTWRDASALLARHAAHRQVAMHEVSMVLQPANPSIKPHTVFGRATTSDFFAMFEVPMQFGAAWSDNSDDGRAAQVVISQKLNEEVFGGVNSVGQSLQLDGHAYRVIGVMGAWDPKPHYYDLTVSSFDEGEDVFLPLRWTLDREMSTSAYEYCDAGPRGESFTDLLRSECVWLQYWAELPTAADAQAYRLDLVNYARDQQHAGRFNWAPNIRLRDVPDWLAARKVVPDDARLALLVAFGFFLICLCSALGLMLAKAMVKAGEYSVRRALGASARAIFGQALVESGVLGVTGGVLGLVLTDLALRCLRELFPDGMGRIAQMDATMLVVTLLVAVVATVSTGAYPAWRSMRTAPALQMKGG
ncbi:ABC transporter permease [Pinirhizobacter sp.]|uniref:ABC transporter permease n=1 Tax=Pinirhizobacter sp. TaxID=2950432 RepID=UPI002F42E168